MKLIITSFLVIIILFQFQCKTQDLSNNIDFGEDSIVYFLDSTSASQSIITDDIDNFFERITITDMEVQMKSAIHYSSREECVSDYKEFLKNDVESFTEKEIDLVSEVFSDVKEMINRVNPSLMSEDIILIKTKAKHYGNSVYYTRENKIIIPNNELRNFNKQAFTDVMLHELFHIISRYNEDLRNNLYKLIGFSKINGPIIYPEKLGKRKLLNPDGTQDYAISLNNSEGKQVIAYPLISSNEDHYSKLKKTFFNYLDFQLYELKPGEDEIYYLKVDEEGNTTLPFEKIPEFFSTIKDNTTYIVHPDEIMADNFIYTVNWIAEGKEMKKFSKEGKQLINEVGEILKNYE